MADRSRRKPAQALCRLAHVAHDRGGVTCNHPRHAWNRFAQCANRGSTQPHGASCGSGVSRDAEVARIPSSDGVSASRLTPLLQQASTVGAKKRRSLLAAPMHFTGGREFAGLRLAHFTSNCCWVPAALPSTVTSAVYLPAGHGAALVNSILVVPASVALSVALCSPATWPS